MRTTGIKEAIELSDSLVRKEEQEFEELYQKIKARLLKEVVARRDRHLRQTGTTITQVEKQEFELREK